MFVFGVLFAGLVLLVFTQRLSLKQFQKWPMEAKRRAGTRVGSQDPDKELKKNPFSLSHRARAPIPLSKTPVKGKQSLGSKKVGCDTWKIWMKPHMRTMPSQWEKCKGTWAGSELKSQIYILPQFPLLWNGVTSPPQLLSSTTLSSLLLLLSFCSLPCSQVSPFKFLSWDLFLGHLTQACSLYFPCTPYNLKR